MAVFSKSFFQESSPLENLQCEFSPMRLFPNVSLPFEESVYNPLPLSILSREKLKRKMTTDCRPKPTSKLQGRIFLWMEITQKKNSARRIFPRGQQLKLLKFQGKPLQPYDQVHWSLKFGLQTLEYLKIIAGSIYSTWPILLLCLLRTGLRSWSSGVRSPVSQMRIHSWGSVRTGRLARLLTQWSRPYQAALRRVSSSLGFPICESGRSLSLTIRRRILLKNVWTVAALRIVSYDPRENRRMEKNRTMDSRKPFYWLKREFLKGTNQKEILGKFRSWGLEGPGKLEGDRRRSSRVQRRLQSPPTLKVRI